MDDSISRKPSGTHVQEARYKRLLRLLLLVLVMAVCAKVTLLFLGIPLSFDPTEEREGIAEHSRIELFLAVARETVIPVIIFLFGWFLIFVLKTKKRLSWAPGIETGASGSRSDDSDDSE